jgi:hypothetical protein
MRLIRWLSRMHVSLIPWSNAMTKTQENTTRPCEQCERYRRRWLRLVWAVVASGILLPLVAMWMFLVAHSNDENVAVARNEIVQDGSGGRVWRGAMLNRADTEYREVAVTIRFLDKDGRTVGQTSASADVLGAGQMLPLEAPLPESAVRMQMYSLQWRTGRDFNVGGLFGPYKPWEFGYLQYDPNG